MRARNLSIVFLIVVAALLVPDLAASKEIVTTVCGRDRCRTVTGGISGVAVLSTRLRAPSRGRFYTVSVRIAVDGETTRWRLVYEARRQLVRAGNNATRSFLGSRWRLLAPDVSQAYARAVKGLEPMPAPPRWARGVGARR